MTIKQILAWADAHRARIGRWPEATSGAVGEGDSWAAVNAALEDGLRGLPGGDSLARLLARHRGKRNPAALPPLTLRQIERWAVAHRRRCGEWPNQYSGAIPDVAGETWNGVNKALARGRRGLPAGSSLARVVAGLRKGKRA